MVSFSLREVVSGYCREVRQLGLRLLGLISLSLGLEEDYMVKVLGEQEQHMAVNYYPKCPEPELTYGLQAHTDPNALTILLQDPKVAGLQVLKNGKWIAVNPQPDAYVINIGDQLQVSMFLSRYHLRSSLWSISALLLVFWSILFLCYLVAAEGRNHERRHPSEIFCSDMPFRPTKICHGHLEVADEVKRCHPIASVPVDFLSSCSYPLWKR